MPLVQRLIAAHPQVPAKLLVGDDRISINPKLNNIVKGWEAASHDWIVMADSNVLMPPDYIERLLAHWDDRHRHRQLAAGRGGAGGLWAELECGFLNTYQARWQLAARRLRPRLRARQDDALAARDPGGRRRHPRARLPSRPRTRPAPRSSAITG